jgi:16S rRNA (guanine1207-N2)-methyltransferase
MTSEAAQALLLPFEREMLGIPAGRSSFMIRAEPSMGLRADWRAALVCEQTFRPTYDALLAAGFETVRHLAGKYDLGLVLLTKHKGENFGNVARGWSLLNQGGHLVCAGARNIGAASIEAAVHDGIGLAGALSKYHCRVFWSSKGSAVPPILEEWSTLDRLAANADGYLSRAGLFSADAIDAGSRLLIESAPDGIAGDVADLGAGWGYIGVQLLRRYPAIRALDLYEAELNALDAARANLADPGGPGRISLFWHDVGSGLPDDKRYDWIVMNPPFHTGRAAQVDLGHKFVSAAADALRAHGRLLMVANVRLPYERALRQRFDDVRIVKEADGYKVLLSSRRNC